MSDLDYLTIDVREQFPELWKEYAERMEKCEIIGSNSFNNFLKDKQINGFAKPLTTIGEAQVRRDHYVWLKLKYE
jgi:hypothetical protein